MTRQRAHRCADAGELADIALGLGISLLMVSAVVLSAAISALLV